MAELSSDAQQIAAAATLLTLSTSMRCVRDFNYYRSTDHIRVERPQLLNICRRIHRNSYSLHNLLTQIEEYRENPFPLVLSRSIHDDFESLHRQLLFYEAEDIVDLIPLIDKQRTFWNRYSEIDFYDQNLVKKLEHEIPSTIHKISVLLHTLPSEAHI